MKVNAMGYKWEKCYIFPRRFKVEKHHKLYKEGKKNNPSKVIIIVLDNLRSHKVEEVSIEA